MSEEINEEYVSFDGSDVSINRMIGSVSLPVSAVQKAGYVSFEGVLDAIADRAAIDTDGVSTYIDAVPLVETMLKKFNQKIKS